MTKFRILAVFAVLMAGLALPAAALAHPSSEGEGYCKFPDGTLTPGHCSASDHASGGHDTHIPYVPSVPPPTSGTPPPSGTNPPPTGTNPPPTGSDPPSVSPSPTAPPSAAPPSVSAPDGPGTIGAECFITHAATPAQICPVEGGMQYWFIGADGSSQPGPYLPDSPRIVRYEGTNPMTGKPVVIDYVVEGDKTLLRVSTYYPDNEYDTNKPYVFTLDPGHTVSYISW